MPNIGHQIKEFKKRIQEKYPRLTINYSYDKEDDYYYIRHNSSYLQYEDKDFANYVGSLIRECFYSKDIFNFSFGYDFSMLDI